MRRCRHVDSGRRKRLEELLLAATGADVPTLQLEPTYMNRLVIWRVAIGPSGCGRPSTTSPSQCHGGPVLHLGKASKMAAAGASGRCKDGRKALARQGVQGQRLGWGVAPGLLLDLVTESSLRFVTRYIPDLLGHLGNGLLGHLRGLGRGLDRARWFRSSRLSGPTGNGRGTKDGNFGGRGMDGAMIPGTCLGSP